jgi:hypothetical protein
VPYAPDCAHSPAHPAKNTSGPLLNARPEALLERLPVETRSSPLRGTRKIAKVIFAYTNRDTDVTEKYFVRVDVTEEFPFLLTKMSPYYDRYI